MVSTFVHDGVLQKYADKYGVTIDEARELFEEMKKFLYICSINPKMSTPSIPVDNMWHQFILWTKDYANYCQENFGKFIHHFPSVGESEENFEKAYLATRDKIENLLGINEKYWQKVEAVAKCKCNGKCSSKCGAGGNCGGGAS